MRFSSEEKRVFTVGARVRITDEFMKRMTPVEVRRYEGRIGTVTGYRGGAHDPIVLFPAAGRRKEVKHFEYPSGRLEVVPPVQETK